MLYTQLTVKLLEHLADAEGAYADGIVVSAKDLAQKVAPQEPLATGRRVSLAIEELKNASLVSGQALESDEMTRENSVFISLDITGAGLRFVESLRHQAKKEGKTSGWMWSVVEKAANIAQLISLALQAVGHG